MNLVKKDEEIADLKASLKAGTTKMDANQATHDAAMEMLNKEKDALQKKIGNLEERIAANQQYIKQVYSNFSEKISNLQAEGVVEKIRADKCEKGKGDLSNLLELAKKNEISLHESLAKAKAAAAAAATDAAKAIKNHMIHAEKMGNIEGALALDEDLSKYKKDADEANSIAQSATNNANTIMITHGLSRFKKSDKATSTPAVTEPSVTPRSSVKVALDAKHTKGLGSTNHTPHSSVKVALDAKHTRGLGSITTKAPSSTTSSYTPPSSASITLALVLQQIKKGTSASFTGLLKEDISTFSAKEKLEFNKSPIVTFIKNNTSSSEFYKTTTLSALPPGDGNPATITYFQKVWSDIYNAQTKKKNVGTKSVPYVGSNNAFRSFIYNLFKAYTNQYTVSTLPPTATVKEKAKVVYLIFRQYIGDIKILNNPNDVTLGTYKDTIFNMLHITEQGLVDYATGVIIKVPQYTKSASVKGKVTEILAP
jgi:hypothetical protein